MINTKNHLKRLLEVARAETMDPDWIKVVPSIRDYVNKLPDSPCKENSYSRVAKMIVDFKDKPHIILREKINEEEMDAVIAMVRFRGIDENLINLVSDHESFLLFLMLHEITHLLHLRQHRKSEMTHQEIEIDCDKTALLKLLSHKAEIE